MNGQEIFPGFEALTTVPGAGDYSILGLPDPIQYANGIRDVAWGGFVSFVAILGGAIVIRAVIKAVAGR